MLKQFNSILIDHTKTVREALKQLDNVGEKILFVIKEDCVLVGSLTDGDIRRWILKDGSLLEPISNVCYKNTYSIKKGYDLDFVKNEILKLKISHIPVIDHGKRIVEILIWDNIFENKIERKVKEIIKNPVIVMAGGKGTRLDPFTRILPKPLIPIGDKSILELIFDKFTLYQVDHFYLSVNHKAKIIKSYFDELDPSYSITYLYENQPLGTVGSLKQLEGKISKDIILTNCDIIIEADYSEILNHHYENKNMLTLVASLKHFNIPYGVCEIESGGKLLNIKEKPEYDFLVNTGMYIINPELLKYIPEDEFFHITHLIEKIKDVHKIGVYPISENSWVDTGEWVEYKKVINKYNQG